MPRAVAVAGFGAFESEPPFQTIVPTLLAVNVTELLVQVKFPGGVIVTVGGVAKVDCVMVAILVHVCATVAADDIVGLTEMYFTQPGCASQGTTLSSLKKLIGVVEVGET